MKGTDVYNVLKAIGASSLHHANSLVTSCTFLEHGGLLSRGYVEDHALEQTPQGSDEIDKKYGIWHSFFVDHVDIHARGCRKKGPNQYGPVLFQFPLSILLGLPKDTEVLVTRSNPVHWWDSQADKDRYFQTPDELAAHISFGDFDKMLVIQTPSGKLNFPSRRVAIILDNPERKLSSGKDAYTHAGKRLTAAAAVGRVEAFIQERTCQYGCVCPEKYRDMTPETLEFWFG